MTRQGYNPALAAIVVALNDAYRHDPAAIEKLLLHKVPCNDALADHPTVVVGGEESAWTLGCLGLMNSIIEVATGGRVASCWSESVPPRLTGFVAYERPIC